MKTPKTYRLSPRTINHLNRLKAMPQYADYTETDLIETAITAMYYSDLKQIIYTTPTDDIEQVISDIAQAGG